MGVILAIVQPYEHMSVAEQMYVLAEFASGNGFKIKQFVGYDRILTEDDPRFEELFEMLKQGSISKIILLNAIEPKLPSRFLKALRTGLAEILYVETPGIHHIQQG